MVRTRINFGEFYFIFGLDSNTNDAFTVVDTIFYDIPGDDGMIVDTSGILFDNVGHLRTSMSLLISLGGFVFRLSGRLGSGTL